METPLNSPGPSGSFILLSSPVGNLASPFSLNFSHRKASSNGLLDSLMQSYHLLGKTTPFCIQK